MRRIALTGLTPALIDAGMTQTSICQGRIIRR